jgi:pantothenate kinase type III
VRGVDNTKNFEVIRKIEQIGVVYGVTEVIDEYIKEKGPRTEPCGTPEVTLRGGERASDTRIRDRLSADDFITLKH